MSTALDSTLHDLMIAGIHARRAAEEAERELQRLENAYAQAETAYEHAMRGYNPTTDRFDAPPVSDAVALELLQDRIRAAASWRAMRGTVAEKQTLRNEAAIALNHYLRAGADILGTEDLLTPDEALPRVIYPPTTEMLLGEILEQLKILSKCLGWMEGPYPVLREIPPNHSKHPREAAADHTIVAVDDHPGEAAAEPILPPGATESAVVPPSV
jgi:hypothetical protein